jgi:hypothetical protein
MRRQNDILWKSVLEEVFDDLLRFVYPGADQVFDMKRGFEFLDKELAEMYPEPEKEGDTRFVDKLVKVFRADGQEEWLLVHIEVQGETDDRPAFAERMFRYFYRIFDRFRKPVTAIAIYTGPDGKRMPGRFTYEFLNTRLVYQFNTLCMVDYEDEDLATNLNPFALVMLAAKKALDRGKDVDAKLLEGKLFVFRKLYERGIFGKPKMEAVLRFLNNYVRFEKSETNRIFTEEIDKITGKTNTMSIIEQVTELRVEEARREGDEKAVRLLLQNTEFSVEKIADLVGVAVAFVKEVKEGQQ